VSNENVEALSCRVCPSAGGQSIHKATSVALVVRNARNGST